MPDPIHRLLADPPDLPVRSGLPRLVAAVEAHGTAVVQAPPGTGKTTLVPPALSEAVTGTVVVTQPRRIAARAAARRLAQLLGEPVGATVGYTVRGDRRTGAGTRVEVVTTGILLRRLQRDPELPGVGAVVLDEVHERHLDADLALAMLVDVRRHLRDDLAVVAMSATVEARRTADLLGAGSAAPVVAVEGALYPVDQVWAPPPTRVARTDERGVTPGFLDHVAATVRRTLDERSGDVLVFLPGAGEISGVVRRLGGVDADVLPLHGRLPHREQDRALAEGPRRRVVVATAVAESSLTVPGVRVVVDAGFSREPRTDHRRGLAGLVTVSVSKAAAEQRAGRAGREGPGAVYRCWAQGDHARLTEHPRPEIATADLTSFALELACWGSADGADLALLDPPPAAGMAAARSTLVSLGALDAGGAVTSRGRTMAGLGTDPRLARALLDAESVLGGRRAAEIVALLAEDVRPGGGDLVAALRAVRRGSPDGDRWSQQARRLVQALASSSGEAASSDTPAGAGGSASGTSPSAPRAGDRAGGRIPDGPPSDGRLTDDLAVGLVVALAHPDRLARLRPGGSTYLMTSGTGAVLPAGSPLVGQRWLAVAEADRGAGQSDAIVRSAAPVDADLALEAAAPMLTEQDEVSWTDGTVVARRTQRLGAIELSSTTLTHPPAELVLAAVREGLTRDGLDALTWSSAAVSLRRRLAFLRAALGEPWPDVSDGALLADLDTWLGPDLLRVRRARDLHRIDVVSALRRLLPWPEAGRLDELAPERVTVPSGARVRVDYEDGRPVLAVRLQEVFGWQRTPAVAGGRVPLVLQLLSPARRPAAVTSDLASFWRTGYPQVRAELRGRYPKLAWPEDPLSAEPTTGVRRPR
ncbi:ATP-dependent helicase C-terminal domain-containing protein [Georgenia sp. 10Sc9-8]|uniref:RNA helicase n=1 Tax=Georgenia halotolerans TaxID=3028317 RepID=A0ABT5TWR8_9MICO|nr:ATP-dependent helicase C-terminal domain-containing protein [Georgenia halotolerans]